MVKLHFSALSAVILCASTALAAQGTLPSLDELIPDEAVANPDVWAAQGATMPASARGDTPPMLPPVEPGTPLANDPGIELAWPDGEELPEIAPLSPDPDIDLAGLDDAPLPALPDGIEVRLAGGLTLVFPADPASFPMREEFAKRFAALSNIVALNGDSEDAARIAARAREDQALIERLLGIYGYYDALVQRRIELADGEAGNGSPHVRFDIMPAAQYAFGALDLGDLGSGAYPELRASFEILPGDPVLQDRIVSERIDLAEVIGEAGYPFFTLSPPELLVDHDRSEADLTMPVAPGGQYRFGQVNSNLPEFLSSHHLGSIARFAPGDIYRASDTVDLRRAILATGIVSSVSVTPRAVSEPQDGEPGVVDMDVALTKSPLRSLAAAVGYGTGEGFRVEGSWEHRNIFPPEGMLRLRGVAGTREQLLGATFRRNNVRGRDHILTVDAYANTLNREAYDARSVSLLATFERVSTLLFQKPLSWSVGLEALATGQREIDANGVAGPEETYFIGAVPLMATLDTSDDLLDPHKGFRLAGRVSPEFAAHDGNKVFYARNQADASVYRQMGDKIVLAARVRLESIVGADLADVAPSRRVYAGGGGSVRGYGYQTIGPIDQSGALTGGRSLAEASLEARVRTGLMDGAVTVVPFVDMGTVAASTLPDFKDMRFGAGLGLRYLTSFGPIRVDVAVPLNKRPSDSSFGVYVGLGQAF